MEGMSERQYAARVGLSRGAIQKAKAAGRLVLLSTRQIDAEASDARAGGDDGPVQDPQAARAEAEAGPRGGGLRCRRHAARTGSGGAARRQRHDVPAGQDRERGAEGAGTAHPAPEAEGRADRAGPRAGAGVPAGAAGARRLGQLARPCGGADGGRSGVEPAAMQKVLEKHVRAQLDDLAEVRPDLR